MTQFRRRPSHRRAPRPQASWLVPGYSATEILHGGRTTHLLTAKASDHRKRYAVGQRLAVKDYVPGPTLCHVRLTSVQGPAGETPFHLGDVDFTIARALRHVRLDDFRIHWVQHEDQAWWLRADDEAETYADLCERALGRFDRHWAGKLAWLLTFHIDNAAAPRLLAARSDELYVENDAQALDGELPALRPEEWDTHIGPRSPYRIAERTAAKRAQTWQARLAEAEATAKTRGKDIRNERRRFHKLMLEGKTDKAMRQLEIIEERVLPFAA